MPLSSFDYGMITVVNRSCNYPDDIGSPRVYMSPTSLNLTWRCQVIRGDHIKTFAILQFLEYCLKSIKIRS